MDFYREVYKTVGKIPRGKVATYGQIASLISSPRAAIIVGMALRALPANTKIPWQRVINSKGIISIENMDHPQEEQADLLAAEGIKVSKKKYQFLVDLNKYLWRP